MGGARWGRPVPVLDDHDSRKWFLSAAVVASVLAVVGVGAPAISNDEAIYARWALMPFAGLVETLAENNYPPLYFLYLKAWAAVAGIGPGAFRFSSWPWWLGVLAGAAWLCSRLERRDLRLLAFGLVALSPMLLFQARVAKYFMPVQVLFLLPLVALFWLVPPGGVVRRFRDRGVGWMVALFCGALLLLIWVHYIGAVLWVSVGLYLLWQGWRTKNAFAWRLLAAQCATFALYLPWMPVLLARLGAGGVEAPVPDPALLRRVVAQLGYTAHSFALGHTLEPARLWIAVPTLGVFWGALAWGCWRLLRGPGGNERAFLGFLLGHAAITGVLGYLMVVVFLPTLPVLDVADRLAYVLPLVLPVVALGWLAWPPWLRAISGVVYGGALAFSLVNMVAHRENVHWQFLIPWEEITEEISDRGESVAVVADSWHLGSRGWYYLASTGDEFIELRPVAAAGSVEAEARRLHENHRAVAFVRSARDTSPDGQTTALSAALTALYGAPCVEHRYVDDSPAMRRLKELFRRGSGVETLSGKVTLEIYCAEE